MKNPKKKISILLLSFDSGGTEKVISLLLKKLKNDFEVTLVLFYNVVHFPIPTEVNVVYLSQKGTNRPIFLKIIDFLKFALKYINLTKKRNIEISISFLPLPNFINGIVAIFNKKVKTIISERSFPSNNPKNKFSLLISKIFYPIFYNQCDSLFSNSIYINNDLRAHFNIKIPMEVIYNPIEIPTQTINFTNLRKEIDFFNIISVGSLNAKKNHNLTLDALREKQSNYKFVILGDGPLKNDILEKIKIYNLKDNVSLAGKVKNVNEYLLNSHCFVLTSNAEGFPNVLLEAMSAGLPCISTNCLSGPLEILNDNEDIFISKGTYYKAKFGILINLNDSEALIKALDFLRFNPMERAEYCKLSVERSQKYSLPKVYSELVDYISTISI